MPTTPDPTARPQRRRTRVALGAVLATALLVAGAAAGAQAGGQDEAAGPPQARAGTNSPTTSVFVPTWPCRLVNTQNSAGPLAAGEERFYRMHGDTSAQGGAASCGIPQQATALEVSITAVSAAGDGYLRVGATNQAPPNATFLNYSELMNVSNTGTIRVAQNAGTSFRVRAFVQPTHVVVDVFGYYTSEAFAVVDGAADLVRGNGVVQVEDTGLGTSRVRFDRDVRGCSYVGNIGSVGQGGPPSDGTVTVTGDLTHDDAVFVRTHDHSGLLTDRPYHLTVTC